MPEIILQPMSKESESKFRQALLAIGECMEVEINCETLSVIKVSWKNVPILTEVIQTLARNHIGQVRTHGNRYTIKPISNEPKLEKGIDPLGS